MLVRDGARQNEETALSVPGSPISLFLSVVSSGPGSGMGLSFPICEQYLSGGYGLHEECLDQYIGSLAHSLTRHIFYKKTHC